MEISFKKEVILENERAILKPMTPDDFDNLLPVALSDKTLIQYSPGQVYTPDLLKKYIDNALLLRVKELRYPFVVFDKRKNEYAGSSSYLNISNYDKRLEIGGTWIGREFQQTGLNRNMKYLMLKYAFETLEFERVEFRIDERNKPSRTAVEKIGAVFEGIFRSHMLMDNGFRRYTCCYSILRQEWDGIKERVFSNGY